MKGLIFLFLILVSCSERERTEEHARHNEAQEKRLAPRPDVMLTNSQMKLGNISTQRILPQRIGQTMVVNGRLVTNEERSEVISSRAEGRIEKLYIKETGRVLKKGEPLYQLYSESLLTLQREYLLAKEQYEALGSAETRYKSFLEASKKKLVLYGMSEQQIQDLGSRNAPQQWITFVSPSTGVVEEINVAEGQYISEGTMLMKIDDLSELWVEAELYPSETTLAKVGDRIKVRVNGSNEAQEATIQFLSPEYRVGSQIVVMRASMANRNLNLSPGMQAQVLFTHSSREALALPVDAVIRDAYGSHVYVQKGQNTFRSQRVATGIENFETVEITEGLIEGDTVAVTGAYLLYSEFILKKGSDPMAGHSH